MRHARHTQTPVRCVRIAAILLLATSAACSTTRHVYQNEAMDFGSIRRVAVLPLVNLSREPAAAERVRAVISSALLATGAVYVLPPGEVARAIARTGIGTPATPSVEDVVRLGQSLKVEAVLTGSVKEYGEVRSGSSVGNIISMTIQLMETTNGNVVWSGSTTKGGISVKDRLLGGGGAPLNDVTEEAVNELIDEMLK